MELNQYKGKGRQVSKTAMVRHAEIEKNKVQFTSIKKKRAERKIQKRNKSVLQMQRRAGNLKSSATAIHLTIAERRSDSHLVQTQARF